MKKISLKSKIIYSTVIAIIFMSLGFFTAYKLLIEPKQQPQQWVVPNLKDPSNKFITKETLINNLTQKQEFITLEVDLNQKVTIDNSWGNMAVFKKLQSIQFMGKGIFAVDLSKLTGEKIAVDKDKKLITLTIAKPYVKSIAIDEQKTIYESPERGILRFGDIKLTPEEYNVMMNEAKTKMKEQLLSKELYDSALKNSETSITNLVKTLFSEDTKNNYNINIKFE